MEETLLFGVLGLGFVFLRAGSSRNLRMETEPGPWAATPANPTPPHTHSLGSAPTIRDSPHPPSGPGTLAPCPPHSAAHGYSPRLQRPQGEVLSFLPSQGGRAKAPCLHTMPAFSSKSIRKRSSQEPLPKQREGGSSRLSLCCLIQSTLASWGPRSHTRNAANGTEALNVSFYLMLI